MAVKEDVVTNRDYRKRAELGRILVKEDVQARVKLVTSILHKDVTERSLRDQQILDQSPEIVQEVQHRFKKRAAIKDREKEVEDPEPLLKEKCCKLADAIRHSKCTVVYTGAGISTEASIPDYRGPNGIWTLLQKGHTLKSHNLSDAEPTLAHMALCELNRKQHISHVVSQNCDGLHLRSGLPQKYLSEVHGNMYIEVCKKCKPPREYIRLFDVTERTSLHKHKTGRKCTRCNHDLVDSIVHFGERGTLRSPLNWTKAISMAKKCDLIVCIGSSLKVLRKYTCLWSMSRPPQNRPKLYIVNLQWTPKDNIATLKINGRCDMVMAEVMHYLKLQIPNYRKDKDPLFKLATPLSLEELETTTRKELQISSDSVTSEMKKPRLEFVNQVATIAGPSTTTTVNLSRLSSCSCSFGNDERDHGTNMGSITNSKKFTCEGCNQTKNDPKNEVDVPSSSDTTQDSKNKECVEEEEKDVVTHNPGWFGKGCRKNLKRRKRTN